MLSHAGTLRSKHARSLKRRGEAYLALRRNGRGMPRPYNKRQYLWDAIRKTLRRCVSGAREKTRRATNRSPLRATILLSVLNCCFLLAACKPATQTYNSSFLAMGTRVDVRLATDNPTQAAQLTADIERALLHWGQDWYPWCHTPGELKKLNAALLHGESMQVSRELRDLLMQAQQLQRASEG